MNAAAEPKEPRNHYFTTLGWISEAMSAATIGYFVVTGRLVPLKIDGGTWLLSILFILAFWIFGLVFFHLGRSHDSRRLVFVVFGYAYTTLAVLLYVYLASHILPIVMFGWEAGETRMRLWFMFSVCIVVGYISLIVTGRSLLLVSYTHAATNLLFGFSLIVKYVYGERPLNDLVFREELATFFVGSALFLVTYLAAKYLDKHGVPCLVGRVKSQL